MGTIKSVKSSLGYIAANARTDNCGGCTHFDETFLDHKSPYDPPTPTCNKGGFRTTKMAVCQQQKPKEVL